MPAIANAATTVVPMVNARRGFGTEALDLLDAAQGALARKSADGPLTRACGLADAGLDHPLGLMRYAVGAVDTLISQPDFAEGQGHNAMLPSPPVRFIITSRPIRRDAGAWTLRLSPAVLFRPSPESFPVWCFGLIRMTPNGPQLASIISNPGYHTQARGTSF